MALDEVNKAYDSQSKVVAGMLGAVVADGDPDRAVIEPWAATVGGRILDVGSGTGRWTGHLASLGYAIEGLEPVESLVEIARKANPSVTFRLGSIQDLNEIQEKWSGILAWYSLIHLGPDELPDALAMLRRVLDDDGTALISFFSGPRLEAFSHPVTTAYLWPMERMALELDRAGFEVTDQHWDPRAPHATITARPTSAQTRA